MSDFWLLYISCVFMVLEVMFACFKVAFLVFLHPFGHSEARPAPIDLIFPKQKKFVAQFRRMCIFTPNG